MTAYRRTHGPSPLAWSESWQPTGAEPPSSDEQSELSKWLSHNDSTLNIFLSIIIIIIITHTHLQQRRAGHRLRRDRAVQKRLSGSRFYCWWRLYVSQKALCIVCSRQGFSSPYRKGWGVEDNFDQFAAQCSALVSCRRGSLCVCPCVCHVDV